MKRLSRLKTFEVRAYLNPALFLLHTAVCHAQKQLVRPTLHRLHVQIDTFWDEDTVVLGYITPLLRVVGPYLRTLSLFLNIDTFILENSSECLHRKCFSSAL